MHGSVHGWWVGGGDVVMCVGGIFNAVLNYLGRGGLVRAGP